MLPPALLLLISTHAHIPCNPTDFLILDASIDQNSFFTGESKECPSLDSADAV